MVENGDSYMETESVRTDDDPVSDAFKKALDGSETDEDEQDEIVWDPRSVEQLLAQCLFLTFIIEHLHLLLVRSLCDLPLEAQESRCLLCPRTPRSHLPPLHPPASHQAPLLKTFLTMSWDYLLVPASQK